MGTTEEMSLADYSVAFEKAVAKDLAPRREADRKHARKAAELQDRAKTLELRIALLHRRRKVTVALIKEIDQCRADLAKTYAAITAHEAAGPNYPD